MTLDAVADLLEGRATDAAIDLIRRHPAGAVQLDAFAEDHAAGGPTVEDAVAAEAYELFGRAVFPFAGVFLDDDGGARGPLAAVLRGDRVPPEVPTFLPVFLLALRDVDRPVGHAVADALAARTLPPPLPLPPAPPPPDPVASETGVQDLADHLCRPIRCGLFLSSPVIERLARSLDLPRGFGDRRRILTELLRAAGRYDHLDAVFDTLGATADRHHAALADTSWGSRLSATSLWLKALRGALR